jgi:hypothetical protein
MKPGVPAKTGQTSNQNTDRKADHRGVWAFKRNGERIAATTSVIFGGTTRAGGCCMGERVAYHAAFG